MISILVPTLNEEAAIGETLAQARRAAPHAQIIVSDGGSTDRTVELARPLAEICCGPPGRGKQLNLAAAHADGDILLFLHADTLLPSCNIEPWIEPLLSQPGVAGGNFRVRFAPSDPLIRIMDYLYLLLRTAGLFFGDSAIFIRKDLFMEKGGFRNERLMEDVELVRWMNKKGRTILVPYTATTSSRRFKGKIGRHIALWLILQSLYYSGVPDSILARFYPMAR